MSSPLAVVAIGGNSLIKDSKHMAVADQYQAAITLTSPVCRDPGATPGTRFQVRFGPTETGRRPASAASGEVGKAAAAPPRTAGHPLTHPRATG